MASGRRFPDQHDHAAAFLADDLHGLVHRRVMLSARGQEIVEGIHGMHAHEHRAAGGDVAFDKRDMLGRIDRRGIDLDVELAAKGAVDLRLGHDVDQMVVAQAIGDEIGDGGDLQSMGLRES